MEVSIDIHPVSLAHHCVFCKLGYRQWCLYSSWLSVVYLLNTLGSAPSDCLSAYSCYMQHVQNDKRVWVCSGKTRRLGNKQPSGPFNYRVRLWKKWWYPVVPQLDLGAVLSIIRAVHTNCAVLLDQS